MIGGPRAALPDELEAAGLLANEVFYPDGRVSMPSAFPALFSASNLRNLRVVVDNGAPVAFAGCMVGAVSVNGASIPTVSIGSVCTRESHRGMGLAGRVVGDAFDEARRQGAVLALVSGGRSLYRRMGCIDAGLYRSIRVDRAAALPRLDVSVREWAPTDEMALHALHHAEAVRHVRDPRAMALSLRTGLLFCKPGRTWVVSIGGETRAYLCVTEAGRVVETAGSRVAILGALPALFETTGAESLTIDTYAGDTEWESAAAAFRLPMTDAGFHGTVKIIDRAGFFRAIEPWIVERLGDSERESFSVECSGAVTFRCRRESITIDDDGDLAALVFGSIERPAPPRGKGELAIILRRLFPMPLPCYGLDYV